MHGALLRVILPCDSSTVCFPDSRFGSLRPLQMVVNPSLSSFSCVATFVMDTLKATTVNKWQLCDGFVIDRPVCTSFCLTLSRDNCARLLLLIKKVRKKPEILRANTKVTLQAGNITPKWNIILSAEEGQVGSSNAFWNFICMCICMYAHPQPPLGGFTHLITVLPWVWC